MMKKFVVMTAVLTSLAAGAETFQVSPGNDSFGKAAKNWKTGDTILLAPGEYPDILRCGSKEQPCYGGLTLRAAIPGTVVFRGDRNAPEFEDCGGGVWKARWKGIPETVFERDTMSTYKYCGTLSEVRFSSGTWSYDAKNSTLYVRTTDSAAPDRHFLTVGVTPNSCISLYCFPKGKGVRDVLMEGFIITGYYSRIKFADQRLPFSLKSVPWGLVISHTEKNVIVRDVTAFLNGLGIGFCSGSAGGVIENCRAFGNRNPYNHSGSGIGIYDGSKDCVIRDCFGADNNMDNDVFLYGGLIGPKTVFARNRAFGTIRVKATKDKGFAVTDCIAKNYSHLTHPRHLKNSTAFDSFADGKLYTGANLLMKYEKKLSADQVYADPKNFDCRLQSGVPADVAKRAPASAEKNKVYFVKQSGQDSSDGRSVKTAFGTLKKAQEVLSKSGADLYITGPIKGDLTLKGLKNATIRGRGAFPASIDGTVTLEDCENVLLERLMPSAIVVRSGKQITVSQSTAPIQAENSAGIRLTHNHFTSAELKDCKDFFVTACVFDKKQVSGGDGWSDYNAYAELVPADEKHSFQAKAEQGENGTFRNAWKFDGRAIDGMPVGPFRRQFRDVEFKIDPPRIHSLSPKSGVITLSANLPFRGDLYWGADKKCANRIVLENTSCTHHIGIDGLQPGQQYYFRFRLSSYPAQCFSNAELKKKPEVLVCRSKVQTFSTPKMYQETKEYFVSPEGSDSAAGTESQPFATISHAVLQLQPGDTLTIRGGTYAETVNVPVSGTEERPITIRGAKGEKVRLCAGLGGPLADGFRVINVSNLIFEDLYLIGHGAAEDGFTSVPMQLVNTKNIIVRRLLVGGALHKIKAEKSQFVLIEDCVFSYGHEGVEAFSTSVTIRNCVFAVGGVNQITLRNWGGEKCVLENCIIFDMLNMKAANAIVHVHDIAAFTERNNCFYTRLDSSNKRIYGWNFNGKKLATKTDSGMSKFPYLGRAEHSYGDYLKLTGREASSFFANPGIKVFPDFRIKYKDLAAFHKTGGKRNERFSWEENAYSKKVGGETFSNYLPTNPEVIKRGCGPRINR